VGAAGERIVEDVDVGGRRLVPHHHGDSVGHRTEVDGDVLGLGDHAPAFVEEGR
jgi:hypothetical protein